MSDISTPLNSKELDEFKALIQKLVPEKSKELQNFFDDILHSPNIISLTALYEKAIIKLSNINEQDENQENITFLKDESCVDLIIRFFKEANRKSFESTTMFNNLWIQTVSNLLCEEEIWRILYKTSSLKLTTFLSQLYTNCKESKSLKILVNRCLINPANLGALTALLQSIEQREGIIVKSNKINKWRKADEILATFCSSESINMPKTAEVKITGGFTGTFLLPHFIRAQALKTRISELLLLRKDSFTLQLNGGTLPEIINFSKASTLKIIINENERLVSVKPSDFISQEEIEYLVSLLSSDDEKIASVSLKIANYLPTDEQVKNSLISGQINWASIFDSSHIGLLLYRLNAIGDLLEIDDWRKRFCDEGGVKILYQNLIVNNHLYRSNPLILLVLEYLIESNNPSLSLSFTQKDFEDLIHLIFVEDEELSNESNSVVLFNILKSESIMQPEVLFSLESLFDTLVSKSIFHPNKIFRTSICSIVSLKTNLVEYLIQFLDSSDCEYCSEFYQLFESSIKYCQTDTQSLFNRLIDLIISRFDETTDLKNILFIKSPNEPFVNGILSILNDILSSSEYNDTLDSNKTKNLLNFILKNVAFNPTSYYPLKNNFYSLLKTLMNLNSSNNQFLFQKLSEIHNETNIPSLLLNAQFSASPGERKGLQNLGSTCYANSVLQQLFNVIEFRNSFLSVKCEENDWTFALQMIFAKLRFFPSSFVSTKPFFNVWKGWDGKPLKTFEQQDAVEFLQLVIDRINEKLPHVADIFKGKIQHKTIGVNVEYSNTSEEDFTTLGLEVCGQKDMNDSLSTFLLPDSHNDYNSDELGVINVQRYHKILKAPTVLIVQLKRFNYDFSQQQIVKIVKKFTFPHVLNITRVMADQSDQIEYELIGVVVHIGNANTGHYFSYCKDLSYDESDLTSAANKYGKWFCCNDTRVRQFDGSLLPDVASGEGATGTMREDTAYILFYKKKLSSEKETHLNQDLEIAENVIEKVANEIKESLHTSVLTSLSYARFIYEICDENDITKGPFVYEYIVRCLRVFQNEQLINDFMTKINKYLESSREFSNYIVSQNESHIIMLLQNEYLITREKYSQLLCHAMEFSEPQEVQNMMNFFISKLSYSVEYWLNFDEFFLPFLKCISLNNCSNNNLLPAFFEFLQTQVPDYVKEHSNENIYQRIKLTNVFKLLVVLLSSSALKNEYKSIIFSNSFLNKWIQSQYHSIAFSQLVRSFIIECPELSTVYFKFLVENANELSPECAAGHFSVLSNFQNTNSDEQIDWCFNFLRTKPSFYIKTFLEYLTAKMKESKIDFSYPFLKYGNIWINEWLFSSDFDLRKSVRKFIATVFKAQFSIDNSEVAYESLHEQHLHDLLDLLISKLSEMAQITSKRWRENYSKTDQLSAETSLPTNTFYSLLSWTVISGKLENKLTESASQLVDVLISHKELQLKNNFPQQRLVEVICLCNSKRFFEIVSPKKFLSAFSNVDCSVEANKTMIFNSIKFVPNDHFFVVAKSEAFSKLATNELSDNMGHNYYHHYYRTPSSSEEGSMKLSKMNDNNNFGFSVFNSVIFPISMPTSLSVSLTNFENDKFMEYVFSQINQNTAKDIAVALWRRNFHEALIDNLFALISKQILKASPESSKIFVKQRCHFLIIEHVKSQLKIFLSDDDKDDKDKSDNSVQNENSSSYYLTIYFQLLQAFTDSYKTAFFGKTTWYGSDQFYPLIRFWNKFKLMLIDVVKLITKSNDSNEIDSACSLLRCISSIDENLAIFIFEQIVLFKGKLLASIDDKFRNSAFLLIDFLTDNLINNEQKRPRALNLLTSEFNSLFESKLYDKVVLNALNRRVNLIIGFDKNLKVSDVFRKNCMLWEDHKK